MRRGRRWWWWRRRLSYVTNRGRPFSCAHRTKAVLRPQRMPYPPCHEQSPSTTLQFILLNSLQLRPPPEQIKRPCIDARSLPSSVNSPCKLQGAACDGGQLKGAPTFDMVEYQPLRDSFATMLHQQGPHAAVTCELQAHRCLQSNASESPQSRVPSQTGKVNLALPGLLHGVEVPRAPGLGRRVPRAMLQGPLQRSAAL